ncbi:MAG TPA: aldo/keto reductase [Propionibacteriaceae bacterium]|nr:aldo/keto reductase [Propionibacteriaceae bacterium]
MSDQRVSISRPHSTSSPMAPCERTRGEPAHGGSASTWIDPAFLLNALRCLLSDTGHEQERGRVMEYRRLGKSGLTVSRIALGCMSFGDTSRGFNEWALGDEEAQPLFQQALELGITFWDTANVYGFGSSEEIVGRAIRKYARRDDIVLAPRCTSRCTRVRADPGCPARRSWSRSMPH